MTGQYGRRLVRAVAGRGVFGATGRGGPRLDGVVKYPHSQLGYSGQAMLVGAHTREGMLVVANPMRVYPNRVSPGLTPAPAYGIRAYTRAPAFLSSCMDIQLGMGDCKEM